MFRAVIAKELRNHLLSFRFLAVFVLLVVIVPVTVLVLANDHVRDLDDYARRRAEIQNYLNRYAHFNRIGNIIAPTQPPVPFQALIRGLSAETDLNSFDDDPLPVMFPLLDLTFIAAVLLSLAALVFAYDAVSGEKEDGTLKLMLSNGVSRSIILLGKVAGGAAALLIPYLVSLAVGMVLLLFNPRVGWSGADWGALGIILLGSVVYIGVFCGLGVFISSRHHSSSASILTCLFVWVLLALVIPNLSPYLASVLRPTPSRIQIGREITRLTDVERDDLGRKLSQERRTAVLAKYPILAGAERLSVAEIKARIEKDADFAKAYAVFRDESAAGWKEANAIQGGKARILREELGRKEAAQTRLSISLSMISPLADLTYLFADLSNTGMRNQAHFRTLAEAWDRTYGEYESGKIEALRRGNPTMDVWNTPVDVGDMPRFQYQEETLTSRIRGVLTPLTVLLIMAVGIFAAAFISFVRTDPR